MEPLGQCLRALSSDLIELKKSSSSLKASERGEMSEQLMVRRVGSGSASLFPSLQGRWHDWLLAGRCWVALGRLMKSDLPRMHPAAGCSGAGSPLAPQSGAAALPACCQALPAPGQSHGCLAKGARVLLWVRGAPCLPVH